MRLKRSLAYTPNHSGLPRSSSLGSWLLRVPSLTMLGPPSAQSSFACYKRYPQQGGVQHHLEGHYPFFIAPTSSCAKPAPSSGLRGPHLFPEVLAGCCEHPCWEPILSRRYLRKSFLRCLALNPDGPTECSCLFLPQCRRPSLETLLRSASRFLRERDFSAVKFRGCHRTFRTFKPLSLLVSQIAPTAAAFAGRPRLLLPGRTCFVTSARTGYAIRPIQAIDGERTFTFPDLRPCRPLQGPSFIFRTARRFPVFSTQDTLPSEVQQAVALGRSWPYPAFAFVPV